MPAKVTLPSLSPDEVEVQDLVRVVDAEGSLKNPAVISMQPSERDGVGAYLFQTVVQPSERCGCMAMRSACC